MNLGEQVEVTAARFSSRVVLVVLTTLSGCHAAPTRPIAAMSEGQEHDQALRYLDMEQARPIQRGDAAGLIELLHPAYAAHAPNGRVYNPDQTLALVRNGLLARERVHRTQEVVSVVGTTGVVIGLDQLEEQPPLARNGERTRRYTNVYVMHGGRWRLLARHFHLMP